MFICIAICLTLLLRDTWSWYRFQLCPVDPYAHRASVDAENRLFASGTALIWYLWQPTYQYIEFYASFCAYSLVSSFVSEYMLLGSAGRDPDWQRRTLRWQLTFLGLMHADFQLVQLVPLLDLPSATRLLLRMFGGGPFRSSALRGSRSFAFILSAQLAWRALFSVYPSHAFFVYGPLAALAWQEMD